LQDCASLDNLKEIQPLRNYQFVKGDICSSDLVNYVLEEEEIEQAGVHDQHESPTMAASGHGSCMGKLV
jgi:dTDP-D-glucose 4,6-dehydratase